MNPLQMILAWLDDRPRARSVVYDMVLWVSVLLVLLVWGLPFIDIDHIWRIDLDELGKISIGTAAVAALLAKRNIRPPTPPAPE